MLKFIFEENADFPTELAVIASFALIASHKFAIPALLLPFFGV